MSKWYWLVFYDALIHMVPEELIEVVLLDLSPPYDTAPGGKKKRITFASIDMPGMIISNRPTEEFDFDGLELTIPSEDVAAFAHQLMNLYEERLPSFPNKPFYKLRAYLKCLVLTPAQREKLLELLKGRVLEAEERALLFYADRLTPVEALAEAQKIDDPRKVGIDRHARFKKAKGES